MTENTRKQTDQDGAQLRSTVQSDNIGVIENSAALTSEKLPSREPTRNRRRFLVLSTYLLTILLLAFLFIDGYSYYSTSYRERPHHSDYRELRPAGSRGLLYGIVGASMMVLMLVYTLRKRTGLLGRKIPLRPFLDFHIYFGVIGPLFIVLHTSFKVQGLVAISFWSMIAVAMSGYLGRYLYQQIPRNLNDQELSLDEIDRLHRQLTDSLRQHSGLDDNQINQINRLYERAYAVKATSTVAMLTGLLMADLKRPFINRSLKRKILKIAFVPVRDRALLFGVGRQRAILLRRVAVLERIHRLFHYWHVIHKPFAIIMYIIMVVHIGVAIWTGYGWI